MPDSQFKQCEVRISEIGKYNTTNAGDQRQHVKASMKENLWRFVQVFTLVLVTVVLVLPVAEFVFADTQLQHASTDLKQSLSQQAVLSTENILVHDHEASNAKGAFSSLRGPHITENFPDPCVIYQNGTTYAFATNNRKSGGDHVRVQIATSTDNETWSLQPYLDALPYIASWQKGNAVWAPDVKRLPNGQFILYYTDSLRNAPQKHCIGTALSDTIIGPYVPDDRPLICPHGGAIDPACFVDRSTGRRYIVYKIDGNSLGRGGPCNNGIPPIVATPIMLQEVNAQDGITLIGLPVELLDRDALDGPLIEAPAMYRSTEGIYFLFFSSNCFTTPLYNIDYATAKRITGPYTRASRPLLITGDGAGLGIVGPGGMDIIHHSYATDKIEDSTRKKKKHKHKRKREKEGHMIVFHGHMTVHNTPSDEDTQRPIQDLHRPFTRGMYSGTAYFRGRKVSLRQGGFKKSNVEDEDEL